MVPVHLGVKGLRLKGLSHKLKHSFRATTEAGMITDSGGLGVVSIGQYTRKTYFGQQGLAVWIVGMTALILVAFSRKHTSQTNMP